MTCERIGAVGECERFVVHLLLHPKRIHASVLISLPRLQHAAWPPVFPLLVRRVGKHLCLQAARTSVSVRLTVLALLLLEEVAAVELHARLVGEHRERST